MNVVIHNSINAKLHGLVSRGIKAAEIDDNGHLIFTLTDNSTADIGKIVPEKGTDYFTEDDKDELIQRVLDEIRS